MSAHSAPQAANEGANQNLGGRTGPRTYREPVLRFGGLVVFSQYGTGQCDLHSQLAGSDRYERRTETLPRAKCSAHLCARQRLGCHQAPPHD